MFNIFKDEMGAPPLPERVAAANATARGWQNKPKCPTCNSTNISSISKVSGALAFGLFSKTARSQFY